MRLGLKKSRTQISPDRLLLDELIDELPATSAPRLRPVTLRSMARQRSNVLAPYPVRTWLDTTLTVAEGGLGVVVLLIWAIWLGDGWGRDMLHAWSAAPLPTPVKIERAVRAASTSAPVVVRPRAARPPAPHPELGLSLPVADERRPRPAQAADYLIPARAYVAAHQVQLPLAAAPEPTAPVVEAQEDLRPTRVIAPAIGLDSQVVEVFVVDGSWQVADYAVGYQHGTGVAGSGNVVLAGHKGLRGGIFRKLEGLHSGDDIWIDAAARQYHYRVSTTGSVWPKQVEIMYPTDRPVLTMLTCTNWDMQRFVVIAELVDSGPAPSAGGI